MIIRELDMLGITDPALRQSYLVTSKLVRQKVTARQIPSVIRYMVPAKKRLHIEAFFMFIMHVDDIVDHKVHSIPVREHRMDEWEAMFARAVANDLPAAGTMSSDDEETHAHVARAFVHTMRTFGQPLKDVPPYVAGQRRTLTTTEYATEEKLEDFIQTVTLLPSSWANAILEPITPDSNVLCRRAATSFQLIDFILDVRQDLEEGRLYFPLDRLAKYGLDRASLQNQLAHGLVSDGLRELMVAEIKRAKEMYDSGRDWPKSVHPASRPFAEWDYHTNGLKLEALIKADGEHLRPGFRMAPSVKLKAVAHMYFDIAKGVRDDLFVRYGRRAVEV
ncbi:squalene/phytoene synthase family protein [Pendulispora brunnea]|uniref:Squalene/phytoene synthase family protein n=1 Tax=Pendulispora brunnea TaxID=2905690 RepID=A0ABZ2K892_9BACT